MPTTFTGTVTVDEVAHNFVDASIEVLRPLMPRRDGDVLAAVEANTKGLETTALALERVLHVLHELAGVPLDNAGHIAKLAEKAGNE